MKKIAFAGLRHGHINSLYNEAANSPELEICAICEEDAPARQAFLTAHPESKAQFRRRPAVGAECIAHVPDVVEGKYICGQNDE